MADEGCGAGETSSASACTRGALDLGRSRCHAALRGCAQAAPSGRERWHARNRESGSGSILEVR